MSFLNDPRVNNVPKKRRKSILGIGSPNAASEKFYADNPGVRRGSGGDKVIERQIQREWRTNSPELKHINKLSRIEDPYERQQALDGYIFQQTSNLLARYKDNLWENDTSEGGRPVLDLPSKKRLDKLGAEVNNEYAMDRFLRNLDYMKTGADTAYEKDRLHELEKPKGAKGKYADKVKYNSAAEGMMEGEDTSSQPSGLVGGRLSEEALKGSTRIGLKGLQSMGAPGTGNVLDKIYRRNREEEKSKYGETDKAFAKDNYKYVSGDKRPFINKDGFPMKELPDGNLYVIYENRKTGEQVYKPAAEAYREMGDEQKQDPVLGFLDKGLRPVGKALGAVGKGIDAVTPEFVDDAAGNVGDGVMWSIDKMERLLMGANAAREFIYEQDEEKGQGIFNKMSRPVNPEQEFSAGRSTFGSIDDFFENPGKVGGIFKAFGKGFTKADDADDLGQSMIARLAADDGVENEFDLKSQQIGRGLTNDVAFDPINLVGGGLVKGVKAARNGLIKTDEVLQGADAEALRETVETIAGTKVPKDMFKGDPDWDNYVNGLDTESKHFTASELFDLVGGNTKRFRTTREKQEAVNRATYVGEKIERHLQDTASKTKSGNSSRARRKHEKEMQRIEVLANDLKRQRESIADDIQVETFVDDVQAEAVALGDSSPEAFRGVLDDMGLAEIENAIRSHGIGESRRKGTLFLHSDPEEVAAGTARAPYNPKFTPSEEVPTLQAWLDEYPEISASLKPIFEKYPQLAEKAKLDPAGALTTVRNTLKKEGTPIGTNLRGEPVGYSNVSGEIKSLTRELNRAEDALEEARKLGGTDRIKHLTARVRTYKKKRSELYTATRQAEAVGVVRYLNNTLEQVASGKNYIPKDTARAAELERVRAEFIAKQQEHASYKTSNIGVEDNARTLSDNNEQLELDDFLSSDGTIDTKSLFDNQPGFVHYEDQLRAIDRAIKRAEKANASPFGEGIDLKNIEIPEIFKSGEGGWVNLPAIRDSFDFNPKNQSIFAKFNHVAQKLGRDLTPEEKGFLTRLAEHANRAGNIEFSDQIKKALGATDTAANRSSKIKSVTQSILSKSRLDKKYASSKFPSVRTSHEATKFLHDNKIVKFSDEGNLWAIKIGDKDVFVSSLTQRELGKTLEENGVKIPQKAKTASKRSLDLVQKALKGNIRKSQELNLVLNRLRDAGFAPPNGAPEFSAWLDNMVKAKYVKVEQDAGSFAIDKSRPVGDRVVAQGKRRAVTPDTDRPLPQDLLDALSPEKLVFNNLFRTTHAGKTYKVGDEVRQITFGNALDIAKRAYNRADSDVKFADYGMWAKDYFPQGITEVEFMKGVTGTSEEVRKTLMGSPFGIKLDPKFMSGATTERGFNPVKFFTPLRQSLANYGKVGGKYDKVKVDRWFNSLEELRKRYPAEYLRMMKSTWDDQVKAPAKRGKLYAGKSGPKYDTEEFGNTIDEQTEYLEAKAAAESRLSYTTDKIKIGDNEYTREQVRTYSMQKALNQIGEDLSFAQELSPIKVPRKAVKGETVAQRTKDQLKTETKKKKDELDAAKAQAKTPDEAAKIDAQLKELQAEYAKHAKAINKANDRSVVARKEMKRLLQAQALHRLAASPVIPNRSGVVLSLAGEQKFFNLPTTEVLGEGLARAAGDWIVDTSKAVYAKTFEAPVAALDRDMQAAYHRASNVPDEIIRLRIDAINTHLGKIPKPNRAQYFSQFVKGLPPAEGDEIGMGVHKFLTDEFNSLAKLFDGQVKVNGSALTYSEIERYLPRELLILNDRVKQGFRNGKQLGDAFRASLLHPEAVKKTADPLDLLWQVRIATEKALGRKYLMENLNSMFGVKRISYLNKHGNKINTAVSPTDVERSEIIEQFQKIGWSPIDELDNAHLFPNEIIPDIKKVLDLMDPQNIDRFGKFADEVIAEFKANPGLGLGSKALAVGTLNKSKHGFDKATRGWKSSVTIPNPGYYTRNLLGEIIVGAFGGVTNPKYYRASTKIIRYMNGEGRELEALLENASWAKHVTNRSVKPGDVVVTARNGEKLTVEDLAVLYYDQAIKTGFLNTERAEALTNIGVMGNALSASKIGQGYRGLRNFGEVVEDWPRMAHFIYAIEQAPKHLRKIEDIAEHAAGEVRKYHFDYADVSKFEKTVMARMFPFYKWNRKAMPLMISMLFAKPGAVMAYPKTMTALSDYTNSNDFLETGHPNGFMPNYTNMVPNFISDMWAYKVGRDGEGKDTYLNIATPQTDILKILSDPSRSAAGLMNPLLKFPIERDRGETIEFGGEEGYATGSVLSHAARQTPITSFLNKWATRKDNVFTEKSGKPDEAIISLLTGGGVYEDFRNINEPLDPNQPAIVVD